MVRRSISCDYFAASPYDATTSSVLTQREVSGGDKMCQQNLSTRTEKDPYWRPRAETSKASERVRREEKPGLVSQMGKRTRRPEDESKEGHGGKPQDDTSSYENMCDIVG